QPRAQSRRDASRELCGAEGSPVRPDDLLRPRRDHPYREQLQIFRRLVPGLGGGRRVVARRGMDRPEAIFLAARPGAALRRRELTGSSHPASRLSLGLPKARPEGWAACGASPENALNLIQPWG